MRARTKSHRRPAVSLAAACVAAWSAAPAGAGPAVPPPTVSVTVRTPPDGHPTAYPGDPATWTVARAGHDGTLAARLVTAPEEDLIATWTSGRLSATGPGPIVSLALDRTWAQLDPQADGDLLVVHARVRHASATRWGPWTTPVSTWLGEGHDRGIAPANQGTATYTVPYEGDGPTSDLIVQLRFVLVANRAGYLQFALHVRA